MERQDAVTAAPKNYRVRLDNDKVRVLESHLEPGERTELHSHPACVVITLDDHKLRFTGPDGQSQEVALKGGDVTWFDSVTHASENIDTVEVRDIIVELK